MKDLPITKDDLYELLKSTTFEAVGAKFDVSGNSIKKWCKRYSIPHLANHYRQYKEHVNSCVDCGCEIPNRQERCNLCFRKHAGYKDTPSKAELLEMSKAKNNFQLSKVYGVSNHTIARWKSKYNL